MNIDFRRITKGNKRVANTSRTSPAVPGASEWAPHSAAGVPGSRTDSLEHAADSKTCIGRSYPPSHGRRWPAVFVTALLGLTAWAEAADWPQWRGPNRNGIATEAIAAGTPVEVWRREIGPGYSSMVVSQGRVYTMGYDSEKKMDRVYCLNEEDGRDVWPPVSYPCGIPRDKGYVGPRATPLVHDNRLYTLSHEGLLNCWSADKGALLWSQSVPHRRERGYGLAGSPLIDAERKQIVLNASSAGASVRLDGNHEILWHTNASAQAGFASPVIFPDAVKPYVLIFCSEGLKGVDLADGSTLWTFPWPTSGPSAKIADPIVHDGRIFASTGYGKPCVLLEPNGSRTPTTVWSNRNLQNVTQCSVLIDGYLYGSVEKGGLACVRWSDGNRVWHEPSLGGTCAVIAANNAPTKMLIVMATNGTLHVVEAKPSGYSEKAKTVVFSARDFKGSTCVPAFANGRIYCRSTAPPGILVCLTIPSTATGERRLRVPQPITDDPK